MIRRSPATEHWPSWGATSQPCVDAPQNFQAFGAHSIDMRACDASQMEFARLQTATLHGVFSFAPNAGLLNL